MAKDVQLSEHFRLSEFACNDSAGTPVPKRYVPALKELCETFLEPLREAFGPCSVNSGYRTSAYNAAIGGARFSFHVYTDRDPSEGVAADVRFKRGNPRKWWRRARRIRRWKRGGRGGIGYYPQGGFIHIDTRGYAADWEGP